MEHLVSIFLIVRIILSPPHSPNSKLSSLDIVSFHLLLKRGGEGEVIKSRWECERGTNSCFSFLLHIPPFISFCTTFSFIFSGHKQGERNVESGSLEDSLRRERNVFSTAPHHHHYFPSSHTSSSTSQSPTFYVFAPRDEDAVHSLSSLFLSHSLNSSFTFTPSLSPKESFFLV